MQVQCIGGGIIPRAFLVQGPWNEGRALVEGLDKASCVKSEKVFFLIIYIFLIQHPGSSQTNCSNCQGYNVISPMLPYNTLSCCCIVSRSTEGNSNCKRECTFKIRSHIITLLLGCVTHNLPSRQGLYCGALAQYYVI